MWALEKTYSEKIFITSYKLTDMEASKHSNQFTITYKQWLNLSKMSTYVFNAVYGKFLRESKGIYYPYEQLIKICNN